MNSTLFTWIQEASRSQVAPLSVLLKTLIGYRKLSSPANIKYALPNPFCITQYLRFSSSFQLGINYRASQSIRRASQACLWTPEGPDEWIFCIVKFEEDKISFSNQEALLCLVLIFVLLFLLSLMRRLKFGYLSSKSSKMLRGTISEKNKELSTSLVASIRV